MGLPVRAVLERVGQQRRGAVDETGALVEPLQGRQRLKDRAGVGGARDGPGDVGDGMATADIGEDGSEVVGGEVTAARQQAHRQHLGDGCPLVVALGEREVAAHHEEAAAAADVVGDVLQVDAHVVGAVVEILEDDDVEGVQLLGEEFLRRERNE